MRITQTTASGEPHGLVNEIPNRVQSNDFKHFSAPHKAELEKQKKEDSKIVEAEYMNSRGPHERLVKYYCRYAGDPIQEWKFIPGRRYKLPLGLVKEINNSARMMIRSDLVSRDDVPIKDDGTPLESDRQGEWLHRFTPVGFN